MKLVILDRDGVINEDSDDYIKSPDEWEPIPGSLEAIRRLNHNGYTVTVVTNQSGIGRGLFDTAAFHAIQTRMDQALHALGAKVDSVFFCPHRPDDRCDCRKPETGLLRQLERRYGTSVEGVPMIGDKPSDLEAAEASGAEPVLVLTGKGEDTRMTLGDFPKIRVYPDLAFFADVQIGKEVAQ